MLAAWVVLAVSSAFAGDCERVPLEAVTSPAGVSAIAVRDVAGAVSIVADGGDTVRVTGSVCAGDADLKLATSGGTATLTVRDRRSEGLEIEVHVPDKARAVVLGLAGPLSATGVASLRAQGVAGPVSADRLDGDLVLDHVGGPVAAHAIGGDVHATAVAGPVATTDVTGQVVLDGAVVPGSLVQR